MQSAEIGELAKALVKAQAAMKPAEKNKVNPFFKSAYADLESCWDAAKEPLIQNELAVIQRTDILPDGHVVLETMLVHSSGEWVKGRYPINPAKQDPQGLGSAVSYARRYALSALVGIVTEDDDGNEASDTKPPPPRLKPQPVSAASNAPPKRPSQVDYPPAKPGWEKELATEAQLKRLFVMSKEAGWDEEKLKDHVFQHFRIKSRKELTKEQVQKIFQTLDVLIADKKQREPGGDDNG